LLRLNYTLAGLEMTDVVANSGARVSPLQQVYLWGRLVKFSHTVFALPFALSMALIVSRDHSVSLRQVIWILLAMVGARTAAMSFNRLVDRSLDANNRRTHTREIPSGLISISSVRVLLYLSSALFLISSGQLGRHCFYLAPIVLAILFFYSWTKRFTKYSHLVLGFCLALAPGGVWYALTATFAWLPVILMAAVLLWVAGFDILYACQDIEFDRALGLYSIPATLGLKRSFLVAQAFHTGCVALLIVFGIQAGLGIGYFVGLSLFTICLTSQHVFVLKNAISAIDLAFFTRNGAASLLFLAGNVVERFFY
jgi:4-hydroxybenzoate polyprenyltransferase